MRFQKEGPISLPNNSALSRCRRVALSGANVAYATKSQRGLGVLEKGVQTTDAQATVMTLNSDGTVPMVASGAIAPYADVYADDNGKVSATGAVKLGISLTTATADGDEIEVLTQYAPRLEPLFTQVAASSAITNTTSETLFNQSYTIPANTLKVGDRVRIKFQGITTATNSTDTLAIKLYLGGLTGTALLTLAARDVANNDIFVGEAEVVIRTIGATGTFVATGYAPTNANAAGSSENQQFVASTTIDTTAAQVVGVSATWSVASASDSCRLDILNVDRLSA